MKKKMTELERWQNGLKGKEKAAFEKIENKDETCSNILNFGTAGVRGLMGLGSKFINEFTITKIVCAFCKCLKGNEKVLVSFDTRKNSKKFARLVQKIFLNNKVECVGFKKPTPTSVLAFSVKKQAFDYGVMITSSHNPKEYNGLKIISKNGGQISDEFANKIMKATLKIDEFSEYYALKKIKTVFAPRTFYTDFLDMCYSCADNDITPLINVCYTPLNGTGLYFAKNILKHFKYKFTIPPKHKKMNGKFETCPYPNPEFSEPYLEAEKWVGENVDLIVATDPDGDRLGVKVRDKNQNFVLLTGNEVGLLLLDYLSKKKVDEKFVVTTVVSSPLVKEICKKNNVSFNETLTGFKNITEKIEKTKGNLILAFEESCGYIVNDYLRDKDGLSTMTVLLKIADEYYKNNMTLLDALDNIYKEYGYEVSLNQSHTFSGEDAIEIIQEIVDNLRKNKQTEKVISFIDFLNTKSTKLPPSNFLGYGFKNGKLFIRPSGTEPKLKFYIYGKGKNKEIAQKNAQKILDFALKMIK